MRTLLLLLLPAAIVGPAALTLWWLYRRHPGRPPPARRVLQVYLIGFCTALPAGLLEVVLLLALLPALVTDVPVVVVLGVLALGVGLIEEGMKLLFLKRQALSQPDVRVPYDAVIFAMAIGLGFATVENRGYMLNGAATGSGTLLAVAILGRLALATPAHALLGAIMGYHAGRARFATSEGAARWGRMAAYLHPAAWHGLYDFSAFGAELADGGVAVAAWCGLGVTVAAMWALGLVFIRRSRRLSASVGSGVPVASQIGVPALPLARPLPAALPTPPLDSDLTVWARPGTPTGRGM